MENAKKQSQIQTPDYFEYEKWRAVYLSGELTPEEHFTMCAKDQAFNAYNHGAEYVRQKGLSKFPVFFFSSGHIMVRQFGNPPHACSARFDAPLHEDYLSEEMDWINAAYKNGDNALYGRHCSAVGDLVIARLQFLGRM